MKIYDWTRKQATNIPRNIAVTSSKRHLTYASLESESNRLAGILMLSGFKAGGRIGLLMDDSVEQIVAMHGILKAGGIIVPINKEDVPERISRIVQIADLSFLMVDHNSIEQYKNVLQLNKDLQSIPWVWWSREICTSQDQPCPDFSYHDIEHHPDYPYQKGNDENSPAFIYFNESGNDEIKGITVTHKNIEAFIEWSTEYFNIQPGDRISGFAPLHTSLSAFDIFGTIKAGAHLYLFPSKIQGKPAKQYDFILENDITQWFTEPQVMDYLARFDIIPDDGFPGLKRLLWHGKNLSLKTLQYWMKQLPHTGFTNLNGPAEATIASSYYTIPEIPQSVKEIPIGKPCGDEQLLILNEELKPVPKGGIGDLFISGDGLTTGYWDDDEKTSAAFMWYRNPKGKLERVFKTGELASFNADGLMYYHGKSDYKIKRTKGIEIEEIEAALGHVKNLREYAVVPIEKAGLSKTEIGCAYVSADVGNEEVTRLLKNHLSKKIPDELIPKRWRSYDKLPRKKNGKIDRKTLMEEFIS